MTNLRILHIVAGASLLLTGCGNDSAPAPVGEEEPMFVSFTIRVENSSASTRADGETWGDDYTSDEGVAFDSKILDGNIYARVYAVDEAGKCGEEVANIRFFSFLNNSTEGSSVTTYFYTGQVVLDEGQSMESLMNDGKKYRLMVLANLTDPFTFIDEIAPLHFSYLGNPTSTFTSIPMWGVGEFDFSGFKDANRVEISTAISLLRAMAQIRVQIGMQKETDPTVGLKSITMSRANGSGAVVPGKYDEVGYTTSLKFAETLNLPTDLSEQTGYVNSYVQTRTGVSKNTDLISFYLPEVKNRADDEIKLVVTYTVAHGDFEEEKTGTIYLRKYGSDGVPEEGGALWDIVRNHIYEYTITGVQDSKISVEATVKDWQYHKTTQDLE